MKIIADQIHEAITAAKPRLLKLSPETVGQKSNPEVWSKKEILGPLIDSAANNHQRFVRGAQNAAMEFPPYKSIQWVEVQKYQDMNWLDLIELFAQYNLHLCRVLNNIPEAALNNLCNIGKESPVTVKFVIEDYLRHLKHHLEKILGTSA
jgi:hypothetical protein